MSSAILAASRKIFCCSGVRLSQTGRLTILYRQVREWDERVRYLATSVNFIMTEVGMGFSCMSTAPCCRAVYSSGKGMPTGLAPSARKLSRNTGEFMTRTRTPFICSGEVMVLSRTPKSRISFSA